MSSMEHIMYKTDAITAYQNPCVYVCCGRMGATYTFIEMVIAVNYCWLAQVPRIINWNPLAMPVARYHARMVTGKAIMYRTLFVKLNNKNKLPTKPIISETTFSQ